MDDSNKFFELGIFFLIIGVFLVFLGYLTGIFLIKLLSCLFVMLGGLLGYVSLEIEENRDEDSK